MTTTIAAADAERVQAPRLRPGPDVVAASVATNLLGLALPLVTLQLFDRVIPNQSHATLAALAMGLIGAAVLDLVARFGSIALMGHAAERFERETQARLFGRMLEGGFDEVDREESGAHLARMEQLDRIRDHRGSEAALAHVELPFAALSLGLLAYIAPLVALALTATLAVAFLVDSRMQRDLVAASERRRELASRRYSFVIEALRGVEAVKGLGMEAFMQRRYERLLGASAAITAEKVGLETHSRDLAASIGKAAPVIVAGVGALSVIDGGMSVGALAASIILGGRVVQGLLRVHLSLGAARTTRAMEAEVEAVLDAPARRATGRVLRRFETLEIRDAHFGAARGAAVFEGLDLTLEAGECVTIEGESSAGKTVLLQLMMGGLRLDSGLALLNDAPIDSYDRRSLRRSFTYLPTTPKLLAGTVLENMTRFRPELHLEEALSIAAELGIDDWFARHQAGLTAPCGRGLAHGLPRSVEDRVPLVGCLVGRPDVILFDEANASLDFDGDERLRAFLERRRGAVTMVLVTRRPSYIRLADRRLRIAGGRLETVTEAPPAARRPEMAAGERRAS